MTDDQKQEVLDKAGFLVTYGWSLSRKRTPEERVANHERLMANAEEIQAIALSSDSESLRKSIGCLVEEILSDPTNSKLVIDTAGEIQAIMGDILDLIKRGKNWETLENSS